MDPRTFLPASRLELAAVPEVADRAPGLPIALEPGRPAVVAFLRHTGCPFAEATMRQLRDAAAATPAVGWIAISHAPADATERWCNAFGGAGGVRLVSDASRAVYADWGLGQTSLAHFLGLRSLAAAGRLAGEGIRNRHPHGTRWQQAGTFALDADGVVRWRHLPAHAGDLPDLGEALPAMRRRSTNLEQSWHERVLIRCWTAPHPAGMNSDRLIRGIMRQGDVPNWGPLERLLPLELCGHFMWMFDVELEDGTILDAYKHRWTRAYFHLAADGRAFYFAADGRYCEVEPHRAIAAVFRLWGRCEPTESEEAALEQALSRAKRARRRNQADHI